MKTIAVLLTCYNRKQYTLNCLGSLFSLKLPKVTKLDVFLVDDGSTDGTGLAVEKNFPQVNVIQGSGDLFWNRGMRLAWKKATESDKEFDYFLWLNDDTSLQPNSLEILLNSSEIEDNSKIICGTTCSPHDKNIITYGGRDKKGKLLTPNGKNFHCSFFNGNIVLIPKYVFDKVGFNDKYFRHSLGDFDYGLRAQKQGISSIVAPEILGECALPVHWSNWCNPKVQFKTRWKAFRSPLGNNPEEHFRFEYRHKSTVTACFHYITNHIRVFFPWIYQFK